MEKLLVVGLGNPGSRYERTRHNIGFDILEKVSEGCAFSSGSGEAVTVTPIGSWSQWERDLGLVRRVDMRRGSESSKEVVLLKPLTYMNRSGYAVRAVSSFFKVPVENVLVVHDELDLSLGVLRLKLGGGEAGHNGLRSVTEQLGTRDYARLRFGVGRPPPVRQQSSADWVLARFDSQEEPAMQQGLERAAAMVVAWVVEGMKVAQLRFHS